MRHHPRSTAPNRPARSLGRHNLAERRLRPAVLWRKGSFGTQSDRGSRFVERILTVVQTLRIQGRSLIDFLTRTIQQTLRGAKPPRLLPDTG